MTRSPICGFLRAARARRNPHTAAEHQRVGGVAFIVENRAVDGRNPDFVAVILHAGHHPALNPARMQHTLRQCIGRHLLRSKAQHIRRRNWFGAHAQNIADDAPHAGVGAAKRLNGRRVVVGFDFERDLEGVIERDDTGVIHERGENPRRRDFISGGFQVGFDDGIDRFGVRGWVISTIRYSMFEYLNHRMSNIEYLVSNIEPPPSP